MMHFVAFLKAAQNGNGVGHCWFAYIHLLKTAFERWVLFNVLAILIERCCADHAQLAASKHRLDHVAGVHCAFGTAGADDGVHLVNERDDFAFGISDFLQHRLEAFFKLAAILRTGHHRTDVEGHKALAFQSFRYIAISDTSGKPFNNRCLANARLANEHRVVLGTTRQHLNHSTNFLVTANDRVDFPFASTRGEILPVLFKRGKL